MAAARPEAAGRPPYWADAAEAALRGREAKPGQKDRHPEMATCLDYTTAKVYETKPDA